MQTELHRQVAVDQGLEPAGANRTRVGRDCQNPRVLSVKPQVVRADFPACGCNKIGKRPDAEFQEVVS